MDTQNNKMKMDAYSLLIVSMLFGFSCVTCNEMTSCPEGTFQPEVGSTCVACSKCPDNQIVRETCWMDRDTVCGPFTEFHPFYRGENTDTLRSDGAETHTITEHEPDDSVTTTWQTASTMMIILLAVMSVLCVVLIVTVFYRCRRDKKDGLMIYVEKDAEEIQAMPGCSYSSNTRINLNNSAHAREPEPETSYHKDAPVNDNKQNKSKIHQFEIAEGSETT